MKIFRSYTFSWLDTGILKWTVLFIGLYVGSSWPSVFESWNEVLLILGIIGAVYLITKHWKQIF